MRVLFLGTGDIALPAFSSLLANSDHFEVVGLVTQPDRPVGRKQELTPPQIKTLAQEAGLPVFQPENLGQPETWEPLTALQADVFVVMAYGQILKRAFIELPAVACINLHASLLPRWRGASCIQAAIREGDPETGITAMHVVRALDAGDVIVRDPITIGQNETGGELHDRLAELAPQTMLKALHHLKNDGASNSPREPQNKDDVTYAPKLGRADGLIDWTLPAAQIERLIRANDPWPGTSTTFQDSKNRPRQLKIFPQTQVIKTDPSAGKPAEPGTLITTEEGDTQIACGTDKLQITTVQPDGSRRLDIKEFRNGLGANVEALGQ